jgi:tRNA(Ile)-lysidine synthetase-like protein
VRPLNPLAKYATRPWVVMVSGGPDSMALLEMCRQASVRAFILHVNYHARPTAMRDQLIVEDYCRKNALYYCIEDAIYPQKGNFQAWARDFRYRCAVELALRFDCDGIFTAHHRDDVLETYEMQIRAHKSVGHYGIRTEGKMHGVTIVRPLLTLTKDELIDICKQNDVAFGIDESNAKSDYLRNRIRKEMENMTEADKNAIIAIIGQKNQAIDQSDKAKESLIKLEVLNVDDVGTDRHLLRKWLSFNGSRQRYASAFLDEILKQIQSEETFEIPLDQNEKLLVQYRKLRIIHPQDEFAVTLDDAELKDHGRFALKDHGSTREGVSFQADDFPVIVRSLRPGDAIKLPFGTKRILRWCIDRKIPLPQRRAIFVIENKHGEIVFASLIGANVTHTCAHPRVFVVK